MMTKTRFIICTLAMCMITTPAMADLFGFHLGNLAVNYDGGNSLSTSSLAGITSGSLYRNLAPAGTAQFAAPLWGTGAESLLIQMTLSSITPITANAVGTMTFSDIQGDTIAANLAGTWTGATGLPIFVGKLTSVTHTPVAATFDGHSGSVDMQFVQPQPWRGAIVQLVASTNWFTPGIPLTATGGSIDVSIVPVPAAVLLGVLGLGVAGVKLRKFA